MTTTTRRRADSSHVRRLSPLRDFLRTEAAGGVLLASGAVIALIWANSPWSSSYHDLWETTTSISFGERTFTLDLHGVINDAAMAIFFFVVGLEIRRELAIGHLSTRRTALLPVAAAIGGMLVPAALYLSIAGGTASRGWAVPVATDIALAIGILAVAGDRLQPSLRAFLLGLAIVDDIGAIIIIAIAYSSGLKWAWLGIGALAVIFTVAARQGGVRHVEMYAALGIVLWFSLHEAGVHATLAGVIMGLLAPVTPHVRPDMVDVEELSQLGSAEQAQTSRAIAKDSVSVVEWLEHRLHPWSSYVIVPIFALANSGIEISIDGLRDSMSSPITWGIIVGLVVGKPLGIAIATKVAVRTGIAEAPARASVRQSLGVGTAAGIGFTVALFITELAFEDQALQEQAKLAVLVASLVAALLAVGLLRPSKSSRRETEAPSAPV